MRSEHPGDAPPHTSGPAKCGKLSCPRNEPRSFVAMAFQVAVHNGECSFRWVLLFSHHPTENVTRSYSHHIFSSSMYRLSARRPQGTQASLPGFDEKGFLCGVGAVTSNPAPDPVPAAVLRPQPSLGGTMGLRQPSTPPNDPVKDAGTPLSVLWEIVKWAIFLLFGEAVFSDDLWWSVGIRGSRELGGAHPFFQF